jgi:hypothetical protein
MLLYRSRASFGSRCSSGESSIMANNKGRAYKGNRFVLVLIAARSGISLHHRLLRTVMKYDMTQKGGLRSSLTLPELRCLCSQRQVLGLSQRGRYCNPSFRFQRFDSLKLSSDFPKILAWLTTIFLLVSLLHWPVCNLSSPITTYP